MTHFDSVLAAVREYYRIPGNETGGSLHVVLDDGNVEDEYVSYCVTFAEQAGDDDGVRLARALLMLTEDERAGVYQQLHGVEPGD